MSLAVYAGGRRAHEWAEILTRPRQLRGRYVFLQYEFPLVSCLRGDADAVPQKRFEVGRPCNSVERCFAVGGDRPQAWPMPACRWGWMMPTREVMNLSRSCCPLCQSAAPVTSAVRALRTPFEESSLTSRASVTSPED